MFIFYFLLYSRQVLILSFENYFIECDTEVGVGTYPIFLAHRTIPQQIVNRSKKYHKISGKRHFILVRLAFFVFNANLSDSVERTVT
jgi:hypothetical protein